MKYLNFILCFVFPLLICAQGSISATYTAGDIPTNYNTFDSSCNGPTTTLSITLPSGFGNIEISSIDINYVMTATAPAWRSDQRSQIYCQNTAISESVISGTGDSAGTLSYNRSGVTIANGIYSAGSTITFEMRAWRTYGTSPTCGTEYNKVDNGTWSITLYGCPAGSVGLNEQSDVSDFVNSFDCNGINGDLNLGWDVNDISTLTNITYISGELYLNETDLTDLTGLDNVTSIGQIFLFDEYTLTSLDGLENVTSLGGLALQSCPAINSIDALSNIGPSIDQIFIDGLYGGGLTDLSGLEGITEVTGDVRIGFTNDLASLNGLQNISTIGGDLRLTENDALDINTLNNLISVGGDVIVSSCGGTLDLNGLSNLITVGGNVSFSYLDGLLVLNGFNISSIGGDLEISNNSTLVFIADLSNLDLVAGQISIHTNLSLNDCCILNNTYPIKTPHLPIIHSNAANCSSYSTILYNCYSSDSDSDGYPNTSDNCPDIYNPNQEDSDNDNIGNACDNCPLITNTDQLDNNDNFIGDACETLEPGKAGINTPDPKAGLEISASELYLSDTKRGLILTNALGECFRVYMDLDGQLQTIKITCPE